MKKEVENETVKGTQGRLSKVQTLDNSVILSGADSYPQRGVYEFMKAQKSNPSAPQQEKTA